MSIFLTLFFRKTQIPSKGIKDTLKYYHVESQSFFSKLSRYFNHKTRSMCKIDEEGYLYFIESSRELDYLSISSLNDVPKSGNTTKGQRSTKLRDKNQNLKQNKIDIDKSKKTWSLIAFNFKDYLIVKNHKKGRE